MEGDGAWPAMPVCFCPGLSEIQSIPVFDKLAKSSLVDNGAIPDLRVLQAAHALVRCLSYICVKSGRGILPLRWPDLDRDNGCFGIRARPTRRGPRRSRGGGQGRAQGGRPGRVPRAHGGVRVAGFGQGARVARPRGHPRRGACRRPRPRAGRARQGAALRRGGGWGRRSGRSVASCGWKGAQPRPLGPLPRRGEREDQPHRRSSPARARKGRPCLARGSPAIARGGLGHHRARTARAPGRHGVRTQHDPSLSSRSRSPSSESAFSSSR